MEIRSLLPFAKDIRPGKGFILLHKTQGRITAFYGHPSLQLGVISYTHSSDCGTGYQSSKIRLFLSNTLNALSTYNKSC